MNYVTITLLFINIVLIVLNLFIGNYAVAALNGAAVFVLLSAVMYSGR